jgi:hypothetical protein|tara:strand:- start:70 stop:720 length:651 start_codon:yes stop_codon:yes gene_type:complete
MRILCVVDKRGRIQWQRTHALLPYLSEHDVDVKALNEKFDTRKYDTVYYSHFSLFDKAPCNCRRVASITSHKCLENMKRTLKVIKHFDAISVNNTMLFDIFRSRVKSLHYTPNGVNTKLFSFREKELSDPPVFGWVGNADREIKNFKTIVKPLMKKIKVHAIATSKKDDAKRLRTQEQMAKYYGMIDWFLVTSSAEGTSNPFWNRTPVACLRLRQE